MLTVQEIEKAIAQLPADELDRLLTWLDEFEAKRWDKQFEADVKAGKLSQIADKALADYRAGKTREL